MWCHSPAVDDLTNTPPLRAVVAPELDHIPDRDAMEMTGTSHLDRGMLAQRWGHA